jgi:hypothetical protein
MPTDLPPRRRAPPRLRSVMLSLFKLKLARLLLKAVRVLRL